MLQKLQRALDWLNAEPGRKRGLATIAGVSAVVLHHMHAMLAELCAKGYAVACAWRLDILSDFAMQFGAYVDALHVGADVATVGFGLWGLAYAAYRQRSAQR